MRKLHVFESISVDGYFCDAGGGMSWAHAGREDAEFAAWVSGNASGGGELLFGRKTYQMMEAFWPTPMAAEQMPVVARGMNAARKYVASTTIQPTWTNTQLLKGDLLAAVRDSQGERGTGHHRARQRQRGRAARRGRPGRRVPVRDHPGRARRRAHAVHDRSPAAALSSSARSAAATWWSPMQRRGRLVDDGEGGRDRDADVRALVSAHARAGVGRHRDARGAARVADVHRRGDRGARRRTVRPGLGAAGLSLDREGSWRGSRRACSSTNGTSNRCPRCRAASTRSSATS